MNSTEFRHFLARYSLAAESGDGARFAALFTEDGVYHDYIYGPHRGRAEIAHMMQDMFHRDAGEDYRWEFFNPVYEGNTGYAWSLSSFTSEVEEFAGAEVVIDGMSRFTMRDGLIAEYHESVNGGVAMAQLGVAAPRMRKVCLKWAGWLRERPETKAYLARKKGEAAEAALAKNKQDGK